MSRSIAPTNQWHEPKPDGVAAAVSRAFPVALEDQWGWSPIPSKADGIFQRFGDQVGIEDDTTTGGVVRVPNMGIGISTRAEPDVEITSHADGEAVNATGETFVATAIDADDDDISADIEWESNRDGALGTGASVSPTFSTMGMHIIRAGVKDGLGVGNMALIRVEVS